MRRSMATGRGSGRPALDEQRSLKSWSENSTLALFATTMRQANVIPTSGVHFWRKEVQSRPTGKTLGEIDPMKSLNVIMPTT